jgi:hypothetical protein
MSVIAEPLAVAGMKVDVKQRDLLSRRISCLRFEGWLRHAGWRKPLATNSVCVHEPRSVLLAHLLNLAVPELVR